MGNREKRTWALRGAVVEIITLPGAGGCASAFPGTNFRAPREAYSINQHKPYHIIDTHTRRRVVHSRELGKTEDTTVATAAVADSAALLDSASPWFIVGAVSTPRHGFTYRSICFPCVISYQPRTGPRLRTCRMLGGHAPRPPLTLDLAHHGPRKVKVPTFSLA